MCILRYLPAIFPEAIDHHGSVVINAGCPFFKERRDDHDVLLARDFAQSLCRWTRNRFREFEELDIFRLTEVLRAKKFLKADDLRAALCGIFDAGDCFLEVGLRLQIATHLHETDRRHVARSIFLRHVAKYSKKDLLRSAIAELHCLDIGVWCWLRCPVIFSTLLERVTK